MEIFSSNVHASLFTNLSFQGFDPHDFSTNGLLLPSTEQSAIATRLPMHRGPHPRYNEMVGECIATLSYRSYSSPCGFDDYPLALKAVRDLQGRLRAALQRAEPLLQLNRRDPMCRNIEFGDLDAAVDAIWAVAG